MERKSTMILLMVIAILVLLAVLTITSRSATISLMLPADSCPGQIFSHPGSFGQ